MAIMTIMSRLAKGALVLVMIVLVSRFELEQQSADRLAAVTAANLVNYNRWVESRDSLFKEKIILSQERIIHKLNELVLSLENQLALCRALGNTGVNDTTTSVIELLNEIGDDKINGD